MSATPPRSEDHSGRVLGQTPGQSPGRLLGQTPSQTVGPYFAYGLTPEQYGYPFRSLFGARLAQPDTPGEHIRFYGQVLDGAGKPVDDALIELFQADSRGTRIANAPQAADARFTGFGRCGTGTDARNQFEFQTVKPGAVRPDTAPCVDVVVMMRGLLVHAFTRAWFDDEAAANERDPVLQSVPADRRATLLARREQTSAGLAYRFDIRMQGPSETVFFDL